MKNCSKEDPSRGTEGRMLTARETLMLRKQIIQESPRAEAASKADAKDIASIATVLVTSEAPDHPGDHLVDAKSGR
ncbi:MAG TPA: hypothetical protein VMT18_15290, partial [Planctomycetota bacterium]|nr:hypothetical protein [Planctomycetota bacterium]